MQWIEYIRSKQNHLSCDIWTSYIHVVAHTNTKTCPSQHYRISNYKAKHYIKGPTTLRSINNLEFAILRSCLRRAKKTQNRIMLIFIFYDIKAIEENQPFCEGHIKHYVLSYLIDSMSMRLEAWCRVVHWWFGEFLVFWTFLYI